MAVRSLRGAVLSATSDIWAAAVRNVRGAGQAHQFRQASVGTFSRRGSCYHDHPDAVRPLHLRAPRRRAVRHFRNIRVTGRMVRSREIAMTGLEPDNSPANRSSAWLAHYEEAETRRRARGSQRSRRRSSTTRRWQRRVVITTITVALAALATLVATMFR